MLIIFGPKFVIFKNLNELKCIFIKIRIPLLLNVFDVRECVRGKKIEINNHLCGIDRINVCACRLEKVVTL